MKPDRTLVRVRYTDAELDFIRSRANMTGMSATTVLRLLLQDAMRREKFIYAVEPTEPTKPTKPTEPTFDPYDFAKHNSFAGMKRLTESQQRETIHCFIKANKGSPDNELVMLKLHGLEPMTELDTLLAQQEAQINKDYPDA